MNNKNDKKTDNKVIDINKARQERRVGGKNNYNTSEYKRKKVNIKDSNGRKSRDKKDKEKNRASENKKRVKANSSVKFEKNKINNKKHTGTNKPKTKESSTSKKGKKSTNVKNNKKKKTINKKKNKGMKLIKIIILIIITVFLVYKGAEMIKEKISEHEEKPAVTSSEQTKGDSEKNKENTEEENTDGEGGKINLDKRYKIAIDAGNGGDDKGTVDNSGKTYEKDLNIRIARKISAKLSNEDDVGVIMTRLDDNNINLKDRAAKIEDNGAEIVVSIHMNSRKKNSGAEGIETWYKEGDKSSEKLAGYIQNSVDAYVTARSRGILPANREILEKTKVPTVMVECGFMNDDKEVKKLKNKEYQDNLAEGIVQGILGYVDSISDDK